MPELKETWLQPQELELDFTDRAAWAERIKIFAPTAIYLLEATDRAALGPLTSFDDQGWAGCFSLIICDDQAELRLEKEPFATWARARLLREYGADARLEKAELCWVRRDQHPLRRPMAAEHAAISLPQAGEVWLEAREYFQPNDSGWLTRRYLSLAGLV